MNVIEAAAIEASKKTKVTYSKEKQEEFVKGVAWVIQCLHVMTTDYYTQVTPDHLKLEKVKKFVGQCMASACYYPEKVKSLSEVPMPDQKKGDTAK